jgi:hypothetical protein
MTTIDGTLAAKNSSPRSPYFEYGSLMGFAFHPQLHASMVVISSVIGEQ